MVSCSGPRFRRPPRGGGIAPKISEDLTGIFLSNFTLIGDVSATKTVTEQRKEKQTNKQTINLVSTILRTEGWKPLPICVFFIKDKTCF